MHETKTFRCPISWIMKCNFCRRWLMNQTHHLTILSSKEELNKLDQTWGQKVSHCVEWRRMPVAINFQGGRWFECRNPVAFLAIFAFQIQVGFCVCLFKKHFPPIVCVALVRGEHSLIGPGCCGALLRWSWTRWEPKWLWYTFSLPLCRFSLPWHFSCFDMWYEMVAFGNRWGNEASLGHRTLAKGKLWKMDVTRLFSLLS